MEANSGKSSLMTPLWGAVTALSVAVALAGGYSIHEHSAAQRLSAQNSQMIAALQNTQTQMDALAAKINAMSAAQVQREQVEQRRQTAAVGPRSEEHTSELQS